MTADVRVAIAAARTEAQEWLERVRWPDETRASPIVHWARLIARVCDDDEAMLDRHQESTVGYGHWCEYDGFSWPCPDVATILNRWKDPQ